ncbi:uncharacterized protein LOC135395023 [Ornithodoros turicata]|uniref:uncharacterized protein LOC135395023 n=1 Tax=Ornithodoros turicata TaxID=34597 RepID=UPI003138DCBF
MSTNPTRPLVVRDEEIVIVVLVLIVWLAVILLFFNKWGKIRMLEPYQPQYQAHFSRAASLGPTAPQILVDRSASIPRRIRQNSVFVASHTTQPLSRRTKSAEDINSLVVHIEQQSGSSRSTAL